MPYQVQPYDYANTGTLAELIQGPARARARGLREQANIQAQSALAGGERNARLVGSLADLALNGMDAYQKAKAATVEKQVETKLRGLLSREDVQPEEIYNLVGPERGLKIVQGLSALSEAHAAAAGRKIEDAQKKHGLVRDVLAGMDAVPESMRAELYPGVRQSLLNAGAITPNDAPESYSPEWWTQVRNFGQAPPKSPGTRQVEVQNPDGSKTVKIVTDTPGQEFTSAPVTEKVTFGAPIAGMVNGKRGFFRPGSDGKVYDMRGAEVANVTPINESANTEPLVAVMGKDNRPVLVRRSQAEGMAPANTREQGRPVTSGDAGRLAEFDTSLDDLRTLRSTLTETQNATGNAAAVGAALPKAVTALTGWGEDAKKRQAVIDRVKQVIGKALEGGVLRKEDEYKYEKILPTIGDTQNVAETKLDGLEKAITQRRVRFLDALTDANYDTESYRNRATSTPSVPPQVLAAGPGEHEFANGQVWRVSADGKSAERIK